MDLLKTILKSTSDPHAAEALSETTQARYRRLWKYSLFLAAFVSIVPLLIMTVINYYQSQNVLKAEAAHPIMQGVSNTKRALEDFISERKSALTLIILDKSYAELNNPDELNAIFLNLKKSFGGFVDLGLIDSKGNQRAYVGPFPLRGKNYQDQDWFHEVGIRDIYVSDVFKGHREFPHFIIAIKHEKPDGDLYFLRATIDLDRLYRQIIMLGVRPYSDVFLINQKGVIQTHSRRYGKVLEPYTGWMPPYSAEPEVVEKTNPQGRTAMIGYAYIARSPFILMSVQYREEMMASWLTLRNKLIWFLSICLLFIVLMIFWGSTYMVRRIREVDKKREQILHNLAYTNKMATIGRLAAGVAHEINNPLAIINENAGLLKDISPMLDAVPQKDKIVKLTNAILNSINRCSAITHRLLGFAKRMDLQTEPIDLESLIKEVLGFLGREVEHKNVAVNIHTDEGVPTVESDRGQLQQVFLNIINNAFAAVDKGGAIDIHISQGRPGTVSVAISDNGQGIDEENLKRIFEPFFTTKQQYGTGLGLSITYGIVEKLGGNISVKSKVGQGTSFTIELPVQKKNY
jgi:signal transduction histidine kinase